MTASTPAPAAQSAPTVAERNAAGHARLEQELADLVARTSVSYTHLTLPTKRIV